MRASLGEVLKAAAALPAPGAVASFNIVDFDMARAIVAAAAASSRPVIVGIATRHWRQIDAGHLTASIRRLIEEAPFPIALHLDHAKPTELEIVRHALDEGFSSIMIDGSALPFERNLEITARVVELSRTFGAGVEGELGPIMGEEGVVDQGVELDSAQPLHTDPAVVPRFVTESGVDALAVAVGTAHGLYTKRPDIRFDLIRDIASSVPTPLVLHGATGVSDRDIREAVQCGIRKINFFSGFLVEATAAVKRQAEREGNDFLGFKADLYARWTETAARQIRLYSPQ